MQAELTFCREPRLADKTSARPMTAPTRRSGRQLDVSLTVSPAPRTIVMSGGAGYGEHAAAAAGTGDLRILARTSVASRGRSEISRLGPRPPALLTLTVTEERVAATARTQPPTPS